MDGRESWDWDGVRDESGRQRETADPQPTAESSGAQYGFQPGSRSRRYGPRTCRICLEVEQPKYPETTTNLGISSHSSRPTYVSDDPELGRLLSPCKCRGSQKYVHEGCLNAWRLANPSASRNYWQCPTCKFTYRMSRLGWATLLSSKAAQVALTMVLSISCIFILGFIADPLLDFWLDPMGTIGDGITSVIFDVEARDEPDPWDYDDPPTWYEHFIKGFFSLGFVGMAKSMFAMSPWYWLNFRSYLGTGRRRGGTGRGRVENMSLVYVILGAFTFLGVMWKAARSLSRRLLKNVSDRVIDVDEDEDDQSEPQGVNNESRKTQ